MHTSILAVFFLLVITPIFLITRSMALKLFQNDLKLSSLRKRRLSGQIVIRRNEKKMPSTYKGRASYAIHLVSKSKGLPHVYLNNLDNTGLYNIYELHSILSEYELHQLIDVEYISKSRFGKEALIVSIDGFPLRGKKATSFHWFGLMMMLFVCFFATIAVVLGIAGLSNS